MSKQAIEDGCYRILVAGNFILRRGIASIVGGLTARTSMKRHHAHSWRAARRRVEGGHEAAAGSGSLREGRDRRLAFDFSIQVRASPSADDVEDSTRVSTSNGDAINASCRCSPGTAVMSAFTVSTDGYAGMIYVLLSSSRLYLI